MTAEQRRSVTSAPGLPLAPPMASAAIRLASAQTVPTTVEHDEEDIGAFALFGVDRCHQPWRMSALRAWSAMI